MPEPGLSPFRPYEDDPAVGLTGCLQAWFEAHDLRSS